MDPDKDIAEERLLRVIEGSEGSKERKPAAVAQDFSTRMKMMTAMFLKRPVGGGVGTLHLDLSIINHFLWLVLAVIGIYIAVDFILYQKYAEETFVMPPVVTEEKVPKVHGAVPKVAVEDQLEPVQNYVSSFRERNAFTGESLREEVEEKVVVDEGPTAAMRMQELMQGLVIVGINRGAVSEAFIEDSNKGKTYFVTEGQTINEMKIKEITPNSVIFTYEGEEATLV